VTRPTLLSDCDGAILRTLTVLPATLIERDPVLARALVAAARGRITIVTHAGAAGAVGRMSGAADTEMITVPDGTPLSHWAQDALLAFDDPGGVLLAPTQPSRSRGPARMLFERLAEAGFRVRSPEGIPARGGNLLAGGDRLLIGADEWRRWIEDGRLPAAFVAAAIDAARVPLVLHGGSGLSPGPSHIFAGPDGAEWTENTAPGVVERDSLQAIAHVDLAVTLLGAGPDGRPRAVVGDPRFAASLTGVAVSDGRGAGFDRIAAALGDAGFDVSRCPLPLLPEDDPARRRRTWSFLPYTNALVERTSANTVVRMPVWERFGGLDLAAVDRAAIRCFEAAGASVVPVAGLASLARGGGGLRCALKVVERGPG
jgi:hypothetical protein